MQGLKALTIVMGVLIVAGTVLLAVVLAGRMGGGAHSVSPAGPPSAPQAALVLDEPAGTRIAGIAGAGDRLALRLQGGGPDRVVLIDPHSGATVGHIALAR